MSPVPLPRLESTPFEAARQRNERWIARFFVITALVFTVIGTLRLLGGDPVVGSAIAATAAFMALFYGGALWRARRRAPGPTELVLRTSLESALPTAFILVLGIDEPARALQNAPVVLWVLAMFISVLRLHPRLSLMAGTLAAGGWLLSWGLLATPEIRTLPALGVAGAVERSVLLLLCGVLAWRIGTSMTELVTQVGEVARERERVRHAFGAYVAEPVVERVLSGDLSLSTERRVISVLFVDIRGFTRFSADKTPTEVLSRLNQALEAFSIEVRERDGIVNKFLGDGLMAIFGAPVEAPAHARQAAMAALAIAEAARRLDACGAYPGLRVGVGLHCGEVVVGDIGGEGYREYTAIGDVVNTAARVEGITKDLEESVLITEAVRESLGPGFQLSSPVEAELRGKQAPVRLYGLRGGPPTG